MFKNSANDPGSAQAFDRSQIVHAEMEILGARQLRVQALKEVGLERVYSALAKDPNGLEKAADLAEKDFTVDNIPTSNVIEISFKARDPKALAAWYAKHLGLAVEDWGGTVFHWKGEDNPEGVSTTIWSPFPADTGYFAPSDASFMINFRVADLHALLAALREEGCQVMDKVEDSEYGKFGWVIDPEGNKVELWQPPEGE